MSDPMNPTPRGAGNTPSATPVDTSHLADQAKQDLSSLGSEVKTQVGSLREEVKHQFEEVSGKAKSLADDQKQLLSTQVTSISEAIDKVATELENTDGAGASYVRAVAGSAGKLSSALQDNDVDALIGKAQDFGRQQPVAFAGVAALLGFAASRFVMASAKRTTPANPSISQTSAGGSNGRV